MAAEHLGARRRGRKGRISDPAPLRSSGTPSESWPPPSLWRLRRRWQLPDGEPSAVGSPSGSASAWMPPWPFRSPPQACDLDFRWSGRRDSNPRPSPWQGDALPTEPRPRVSDTLPRHARAGEGPLRAGQRSRVVAGAGSDSRVPRHLVASTVTPAQEDAARAHVSRPRRHLSGRRRSSRLRESGAESGAGRCLPLAPRQRRTPTTGRCGRTRLGRGPRRAAGPRPPARRRRRRPAGRRAGRRGPLAAPRSPRAGRC